MLSPDKEKVVPPPYTAGIEHDLLRFPDTRLLDNKHEEVEKSPVATGIFVTPVVMGKKPAAVLSYIEPFDSRLWNKMRIELE